MTRMPPPPTFSWRWRRRAARCGPSPRSCPGGSGGGWRAWPPAPRTGPCGSCSGAGRCCASTTPSSWRPSTGCPGRRCAISTAAAGGSGAGPRSPLSWATGRGPATTPTPCPNGPPGRAGGGGSSSRRPRTRCSGTWPRATGPSPRTPRGFWRPTGTSSGAWETWRPSLPWATPSPRWTGTTSGRWRRSCPGGRPGTSAATAWGTWSGWRPSCPSWG